MKQRQLKAAAPQQNETVVDTPVDTPALSRRTQLRRLHIRAPAVLAPPQFARIMCAEPARLALAQAVSFVTASAGAGASTNRRFSMRPRISSRVITTLPVPRPTAQPSAWPKDGGIETMRRGWPMIFADGLGQLAIGEGLGADGLNQGVLGAWPAATASAAKSSTKMGWSLYSPSPKTPKTGQRRQARRCC